MSSRRTFAFGVALVVVVAAGVASAAVAERRAFDAEEEHLTKQLRDEPCLVDWGTDEGAAEKRASVTGIAAGGLRVVVSMPYAYTVEEDGEPVFADTASEAVYVVTVTDTRRVRGDDVAICQN